jgi:hypothetical protein
MKRHRVVLALMAMLVVLALLVPMAPRGQSSPGQGSDSTTAAPTVETLHRSSVVAQKPSVTVAAAPRQAPVAPLPTTNRVAPAEPVAPREPAKRVVSTLPTTAATPTVPRPASVTKAAPQDTSLPHAVPSMVVGGGLSRQRHHAPAPAFAQPEGTPMVLPDRRPGSALRSGTGLQHGPPREGQAATGTVPPAPQWYKTPSQRAPG